MDEPVMTTEEINAWRMVGADMGLEFDELGHPYKPGLARDQTTLEFYQGAYDWRPLEDDSDCMGLVVRYDLTVIGTQDGVLVRSSNGPILTHAFYVSENSADAAVRRAVFEAAAKLVRRKLTELDSVNTCTLNKL